MIETSTHRQILKSTGIIGGSQFVTILLGIARTKIIAVLLGPIGIGLIGLYQSLIDILRNATSLGINFSAVRDVAISNETGDLERISITIKVLRLWAFTTGLLGMLLTIIFCKTLSMVTFGNVNHALEIALLSLVILVMAISGGQLALLQGMRELGKMAKANIMGAVIGLSVSIPLYWYYGIAGIVPALIFTSLSTVLLSWMFVRKIKIQNVSIRKSDAFKAGLGMAKLGFFTVITSLVGAAVMYAVRVFIQRKLNLDAVGYFQAALSLSVVYLAIILNAMAADFYPRLSAHNSDNTKVNKLTNEQTEIALLIASPIIIGMLTFLPWVVYILYSYKFSDTIIILQWQILGTFLRVLAFPLGYLLLAKGKGLPFIITDLSFNLPYIIIIFAGWTYGGLEITGISYLISYIFCFVTVLLLSRKLSNFRFSKMNISLIIIFGTFCLISFLNVYYLNGYIKYTIGSFLVVISVAFSLYRLNEIINLKNLLKFKINRSQ